jgi:release factor glutamine methyltransferase
MPPPCRAGVIASLNERQPAEKPRASTPSLHRRVSREPLSHILGVVGFWTLDLAVTADVLTPRADTEIIVEAALSAVPDKTAPSRILDIGTGSGAIALALLSERPNACAVATDLSEAALEGGGSKRRRCGLPIG